MSAKKQTFEQEIARLEEIVAALEKGDAPLADSLALFEEGTKLIAACSQELDAAEQKVVKLMKGPDGAPVELPVGRLPCCPLQPAGRRKAHPCRAGAGRLRYAERRCRRC